MNLTSFKMLFLSYILRCKYCNDARCVNSPLVALIMVKKPIAPDLAFILFKQHITIKKLKLK